MSDFAALNSEEQTFPIPADTHEALVESAQNQGRTVQEEAEHILQTHLVSVDETKQ
jgi:hypothetical protein